MSPYTYNPGHDLAGRYRIVELLGVGRTAEVYLADDLSLDRTVVVKVLLAHLAAHEDIRRAFRDRIVRSATLSHPHLARVYDGGQESGSIFMISEFLGGGSFEDVLTSGRRLSLNDVARLGRDVSSALAYVHANGFIHGALSPSKLLFDGEGRVRLSDIALAGLGDGYRERISLDDVRYLSPEQVLGEIVGPKTDVYSLALILFEAATGTTPFDGMTAEIVLRSRINSPLPVRPELGTLDMLLAQGAVPDPLLRLDAEQFAGRLSTVLNDDAPLVVAPVRGDVPILERFAPLEPRTSIGFRPPSADQIVGTGTGLQPVANEFPHTARHAATSSPRGESEFRQLRSSPGRGYGVLPPNRTPQKRRLGFLVAAIVIVVAGVGGAAAWKLGLFTSKKTVPSLVGETLAQATALLKSDGFTLKVNPPASSSTVAANDIMNQSPLAGATAKSGASIIVRLSDGPNMVTMRNYLFGETCTIATTRLHRLGVAATCPTNKTITSTHVAIGGVARILYRNTTNPVAVPKGSSVILELSTGPGPTSGTTTTTTSSTGVTTTTTTLAGEGPRAAPNVVGMNQAEVFAAFHKAQLYFTTSGPGAGTTKWTTVVSEVPAAGTMVPWHSSVALNVGE
jgi:serine/threonine-protein kinase